MTFIEVNECCESRRVRTYIIMQILRFLSAQVISKVRFRSFDRPKMSLHYLTYTDKLFTCLEFLTTDIMPFDNPMTRERQRESKISRRFMMLYGGSLDNPEIQLDPPLSGTCFDASRVSDNIATHNYSLADAKNLNTMLLLTHFCVIS